ncbi:MAG: transposase [Nitrospiraceae bacterium]|nr:transposase [Nitrospiraceae bacterium]
MARKPRIEFSGAFYHVIVRGNQKQRIFKDTADFQKYLLILTVYKNRMGSRIYAYVLMNNHIHLLIETGDIPLSKVMQGINQSYTLYFNRRYRTVGHLFQGRYKAILCDREAYLLGLVQYIHRNPLRAGIADRLDGYPWSSHHAYSGKKNPLGLVDTDHVLRLFSENRSRARRKYREFMAEGDAYDKNDVYTSIDQRLKGDDEFVDRILQLEKDAAKPWHRRPALDAIAAAIKQRHQVTLADMRSMRKSQPISWARKVFSILAHDKGYKAVEIGRYLDKDPSKLTTYLRERGVSEGEVKEASRLLKDSNLS